MLAAPHDPELLYEFGDEVPPATRPFAQGDVLREVVTAGGVTLPLAMIIAHPCSMRRTATELRPELVVAELRPLKVPAGSWATSYFDWFPLPDLRGESKSWAASFHHLHTVKTDQFASLERVTVLSEFGQMVLLQRWINHMARFIADEQEITELIRPVQYELSLQQDWCDHALSGEEHGDADALAARITELGGEYQQLLGAPNDPASLRSRLHGKEPTQIAARREIRVELQRRYPGKPA